MAAAVAAPTPVVGGALERMAAAYAEQLGELDGWLALRTPGTLSWLTSDSCHWPRPR